MKEAKLFEHDSPSGTRLSKLSSLPPSLLQHLDTRRLLGADNPASLALAYSPGAAVAKNTTAYAVTPESGLTVWNAAHPHNPHHVQPPAPADAATAALVGVVPRDAADEGVARLLVCWAGATWDGRQTCTLALYTLPPPGAPPQLAPLAAEHTASVHLADGERPELLCVHAPDNGTDGVAAAVAISSPGASVELLALHVSAANITVVGRASRAGAARSLLSGVVGSLFGLGRTAGAPAVVRRLACAPGGGVTLLLGERDEDVLESWQPMVGGNYALAESLPLARLVAQSLEAGGGGTRAARVADMAYSAEHDRVHLLVASVDAHRDVISLALLRLPLRGSRAPPPPSALVSGAFALAPGDDPSSALAALLPRLCLAVCASRGGVGPSAILLRASVLDAGRGDLGDGGAAWVLRGGEGAAPVLLLGSESSLIGGVDELTLAAHADESGLIVASSAGLHRIPASRPRFLASSAADAGLSDAELRVLARETCRAYGASEVPDAEGRRALSAAAADAAADPRLLTAASSRVAEALAALAREEAEGGGVATTYSAAGPADAAVAQSELALRARAEGAATVLRFVAASEQLRRLASDESGRLAEAREAMEKASAALALRALHNKVTSADDAEMLVRIVEEAVSGRTTAAAAAATAPVPDAQEAFYGSILEPGRIESLLSAALSAAKRARQEEDAQVRLRSLRLAAEAARAPVAAALDARDDVDALLGPESPLSYSTWTAEGQLTEELLDLSAALASASHGELGAEIAALHAVRLRCLLAPLRRDMAISDASRAAVAVPSATPTPPASLATFQAARAAAASQLLEQVGAIPQAAALAEEFHDFATLARLSASLTPPTGAAAQTELRVRLLRKFAEGSPASLYANEELHEASFGLALLRAYHAQGGAGCARLFRITEECPPLAPVLAEYLQAHPRLEWILTVDRSQHAGSLTAGARAYETAARGLYGWGMHSDPGASVADRKVMLALGRLCHRAAVLASKPALAAAGGAAFDLGPDQMPGIPGVSVAVDGTALRQPRDVSLRSAEDEYYCLWMQEAIPWLRRDDSAANDPESTLDALVEHASEPQLQYERQLSATDALKLALDVAQKTAWRYSPAAEARRRARFARVLAVAAHAQLDAWRDLGSRLPRLSDSQLQGLLKGGGAHDATPEAGPLILFELLEYEEQKQAEAHDGPSSCRRQPVRLDSAPDSLLSPLLEALAAPVDAVLAAAFTRASATARSLAVKPQAALARGAAHPKPAQVRPALALADDDMGTDEWHDVEVPMDAA